jgi:hypothetical protein
MVECVFHSIHAPIPQPVRKLLDGARLMRATEAKPAKLLTPEHDLLIRVLL